MGRETMVNGTGELFIGISGWRYSGWRGVFYPKGLPHRRELEYASRQVNSIEINGSFYSLQRPEYYRSWHDATPNDFCFAVKGGRYITHMKLLKDAESGLANFFGSGPLELGEKLGPFLWQFPPRMRYQKDRLEHFLEILPRTHDQAIQLVQKNGAPWATKNIRNMPSSARKLWHAIEVRNASFVQAEFVDLLRQYQCCLVVADTAGKWPLMEDITSDFTYIRLHGDKKIYESGYTDRALRSWAERIRLWRIGQQPSDAKLHAPIVGTTDCRRVFVYFDNDIKVCAPFDAIKLGSILRNEIPRLNNYSPRP